MTKKTNEGAAQERRTAALRPVYRHIDELVTGHPLAFIPSDDDEMGEDNDLIKLCIDCRQAMKDSGGERSYAPGAREMLRVISRLRAHTPAGIFQKALVVRMAMSGGAQVAESIAHDLLGSETIRRAIWPAVTL